MLRLRREAAERYLARLGQHPDLLMPFVPSHVTPNWQSFQLRLRAECGVTRNDLMERLHGHGVPTRRGVMASHLEPPYRSMHAKLPVTEMLAEQCLQLPMHPALTQDQVDFVANEVIGALTNRG
jgi:perosamine synthetase